MVLAFGLRLFFFLYTHRTWEDALITVQHSEDFVRGMGLSHPVPPGEGPLHGFTSPLSVLLPLVGDLMHVGFGVTFLKLVSLFAAMASVWLGARIALAIGLPEPVALTAAAFLAVEHHQILWGMSGMETQVVTFCYLFVIWSILSGTPWQKGIALGLAMLARPDAVFLVLIALAFEWWRLRNKGNLREIWPAVGGLVLLYTPWLIFTTIYYGSPVPNTVIAKELGYPSVHEQMANLGNLDKLHFIVARFVSSLATLGPSYGGNGTGFVRLWDHYAIGRLMLLLLLFGACVALKRRHANALLLFAFVLTYATYLTLVANIVFGWYTVPVVAGAVIGSLYGLWALVSLLTKEPLRLNVVSAIGVAYILCLVVCLPFTMRSDKYVQIDIESGVRKQMGIYLHEVSLPSDTIASESLGYVGYYSQRVVYDYPGLCSRRVVQYLKDYPKERNIMGMIYHLQPNYLVLRPVEFEHDGVIKLPWLTQDYELVRVFKANPQNDRRIIGSDKNIDQEFDVFRRKGKPVAQSGM